MSRNRLTQQQPTIDNTVMLCFKDLVRTTQLPVRVTRDTAERE
jgi:hypothetical protein